MDSFWSEKNENTENEFSKGEEWFPNVHHQPFPFVFFSSTSLIAYKTFLVELYYVENQKSTFFVSLQILFGDNFPSSMHFISPTLLCFYFHSFHS